MKNFGNLFLVGAIMVFVLGCNCGFSSFGGGQSEPAQPKQNQPTSSQPNKPTTGNNENKSLTDKATDVVTTGEKIGIQECDDVMDGIRSKIENENTDFVTKAVLKTLESQFRQKIKESLDQNQTDREATAKFCKELKKNWDEQEAKQPAK